MNKLKALRSPVLVAAAFALACLIGPIPVQADLRQDAEAEGKLVYATFNAKRSKAVIDGFKQLYPNPVFANIHPTGLSAKAPHSNAGKLFIDFGLSKRGHEVIRVLKRIPDRNDTLPDPPSLVQGITPAFAPTEVFEEFERYAKLFHESFGGR